MFPLFSSIYRGISESHLDAVVLLAALLVLSAEASAKQPWRLVSAADLPAWLHVSGSHRTRYETLDNQFRSVRQGGDQMLALRSILLTELRLDPLRIGVELIDSRAYLDDSGTPLSTTMVNPGELLQGYVAWTQRDVFQVGSESTLRVGRLTLDVGSRRFVARSLYRNTINTFTGAEWRWHGSRGNHLQVFYTLPVNRKPNTATALRNNDVEFDEEHGEVRFWGLYYDFGRLAAGHRGEVYLLGLDENDAGQRPTRNRELYTPGFRIYRPKALGHLDYLLEAAVQFGEVRATTATTDTTDLDHFAHFEHLEIGYTWAQAWMPRINADFDYASGDDNPRDSDNERFDTLFGARRFDFGPTGMYGPFARSNLLSPGLRLNLQPTGAVKLMVSYRGFWLASDTDAWTTSGVRDRSGATGSFIGQQIEARLRWEVVPGNYRFEAGVANLFAGGLMRDAPNSPDNGDVFYAYTQAGFNF
jgi:hypothetical protein